MTIPKITKITPTTGIHVAYGKVFHIELSNGERFIVYSEQLIDLFCCDEDGSVDEDKADRSLADDFQDLIGEEYI